VEEARPSQSDRPNPRCVVCSKPIAHGQPGYRRGLQSVHIECADPHQPTILIADDTTDTRELYAAYFRIRGFLVFTAADGAAAVQVALEQVPDAIVMDLAMPHYDGLVATQRIKDDPRTRGTRVILLTGYPMSSVSPEASKVGVDRYLTKPCLPEELERHVNELRRPKDAL
jgi:CheY-like chemotaxis protein